MRFTVNGEDLERGSFWVDGESIILLDQRRLPSEAVLLRVSELDEFVEAIRTLEVRGAPAIGAFGGMRSFHMLLQRGLERI